MKHIMPYTGHLYSLFLSAQQQSAKADYFVSTLLTITFLFALAN